MSHAKWQQIRAPEGSSYSTPNVNGRARGQDRWGLTTACTASSNCKLLLSKLHVMPETHPAMLWLEALTQDMVLSTCAAVVLCPAAGLGKALGQSRVCTPQYALALPTDTTVDHCATETACQPHYGGAPSGPLASGKHNGGAHHPCTPLLQPGC